MNFQSSKFTRGFLPLCAVLLLVSGLRSEPVVPEKGEDKELQQTELSNRMQEYFAHKKSLNRMLEHPAFKAIWSVIVNFNDAWMLERVDSEWQNGDCFLRFHFQARAEESLVLRAQINPTTGDVLSVEKLEQGKTEQIAVSSSDVIGNVAALKLYLSDFDRFKDIKGQYFQYVDIVRKKNAFLDGFGSGQVFKNISAENLILVRRRFSLEPLVYGQSASTFVYDAQTGEVVIKFIGDMLDASNEDQGHFPER